MLKKVLCYALLVMMIGLFGVSSVKADLGIDWKIKPINNKVNIGDPIQFEITISGNGYEGSKTEGYLLYNDVVLKYKSCIIKNSNEECVVKNNEEESLLDISVGVNDLPKTLIVEFEQLSDESDIAEVQLAYICGYGLPSFVQDRLFCDELETYDTTIQKVIIGEAVLEDEPKESKNDEENINIIGEPSACEECPEIKDYTLKFMDKEYNIPMNIIIPSVLGLIVLFIIIMIVQKSKNNKLTKKIIKPNDN